MHEKRTNEKDKRKRGEKNRHMTKKSANTGYTLKTLRKFIEEKRVETFQTSPTWMALSVTIEGKN